MEKQIMIDNEEFRKYSRKALSTRLKHDNLAYFLKYAQEQKTETISETFNLLIERLSQLEPLDDVVFTGTRFEEVEKRVAKEFLVENPAKVKETISLSKKKLPPIDLDSEDDDEDEGVLII